MATYRFPAASPGPSAVDMLLKGIALRQAMNREERGEAQDTREAALNALRVQQTQQGINQNALVLDELRRAMGEEAAVREAMPALRAAPPTSIATMPGRPAVPAQFAAPEPMSPEVAASPEAFFGPQTMTAPARPAVEPRSIYEFTEAGLMEPAGGPAGYERLKRTKTGQAFLAERKPLSAVDVEQRLRVEQAKAGWLAALGEAEQHRNTLDPTGMNMVRAYHAAAKGLRILAEVTKNPENVTKAIAELTERSDKLAKDENARLLIAEDQRAVIPALQKLIAERTPENISGYVLALLNAKTPEIRKQGITFMQADATDALKKFREDQETAKFARFLDAARAEIVAMHGQGKDWSPDLWFAAGRQVMERAQREATTATDEGVAASARAVLDSANATLMHAIHGKGKGAENLGKLFWATDAKEQLPVYREAVRRVKATVTSDEKDPRYWPAVMQTVKEMTAAGVRPSAVPREQFWQSPHKRLQELMQLDRAADMHIKTAQTAIDKLNEGVILRTQRSSPAHTEKLKPYEDAIAAAKNEKTAIKAEMAGLPSGIAPPPPKSGTAGLVANPPPVGLKGEEFDAAMLQEMRRLAAMPGATRETVKQAMLDADWPE